MKGFKRFKIKNIISGNQEGFSLVEISISLAILATVAYMGIGSVSTLNKSMKQTVVKSSQNDIVEGLFSKFGDNAKNLQVDLSDKSSNEIFDDLETYPMAWEIDGRIGKQSECIKCKGRYAVVVKPYTNYRGLFLMTVRVKHPTIKGGSGFIEITKLLGNF